MGLRKRISVFLDPSHLDGLKALKERDGISEAEAIRRAVSAFLSSRRIAVGDDSASRRPRAGTTKQPTGKGGPR